MIRENLQNVQFNLNRACERAGRKPEEVVLIAVSKTKPLAMLEEAYAQRRQQQILGISWAQRESAAILHEVAQNPGTGGEVSAGAGLGMGMAAGSVFGTMAQQMFTPMQNAPMQQPVSGQSQQTTPQNSRFVQTTQGASGNGVKCPNCGTENGAGSKFCNNCGNKLQQDKPKCPNCGTENTPGSKFCNNCGTPLGAAPEPKPLFCGNCGTKADPGSRFCNNCGQPLA